MSQLTPEEYQQMLDYGQQTTDLDQQIAMQQAMAARLREGNQLQMQPAGRVTLAPHWMQFLGKMAKEGVAARKEREAQEAMKKKSAGMAAQNAMILRALSRQQPDPGWTGGGNGLRLPGPRSPFQLGGDQE